MNTVNGRVPSDQPESIRWDEKTDVLIVGSGFAGLAAAIEAKQAGASILVMEKMKGYGGNSIISDGVLAAAGMPMQAQRGIEDSPELMYRDMLAAGLGLNHPKLVEIVARRSWEAAEWTIRELGVQYLDRVDQFGGHSVPRCLTPYNKSGSAIILKQVAKLKQLGERVRTQMRLEEILLSETGRVMGARVTDGHDFSDPSKGVVKFIKADRAIILAAGGFANDIPFRMTQDPRLTPDIDSTNKSSTTAEALREAMRIGAMPVHLSWIQLGPWASPDEKMYGAGPDFASYIAFPYGLAIDPKTGKRFVNELADRKHRADAILRVGHPCLGITDRRGVEVSGYTVDKGLKKGVVKGFSSWEDLAAEYGVDPEVLKESIARFNQFIIDGVDRDFGKPFQKTAEPLAQPPFYCVRLWPKVHHTMGGVHINEKAQVMDIHHRVIAGLYAAGEVTGGVHGACRLGSCAIPDCLIFGRIAGQQAAGETPW